MKRQTSIVEIAGRVIAGRPAAVLISASLVSALLFSNWAIAQRSVIIIPNPPEVQDVPAAREPPGPDISLAQVEHLNATIKVENPAGVSIDLIPRLEVAAGSRIGFHITTRKAGYLVLLGVDPAGKLRQMFPDPTGATHGLRDSTNLVRPGRPLTLPQVGTSYAGFEFVADRSPGMAMVIALLSEKPVQVVDLPDTPPPGFAPDQALRYVRDQVRTLKVPTPNSGELEQPNWSIDGRFYLIK
jgi:hypothetical protein